jgi:hypothetical protein
VFKSEGTHLDTVILGGKRYKELEGIAIGPDSVTTHPPDVRQVVMEELVGEGGKFHIFHLCQMVKS